MNAQRIAVLGTFDLQNYGDLLFPLLTRHELERRLPGLEILPFSYHPKDGSEWPYTVFPIEELADRLEEIDAVIIGGGHLIRFDHEVASGYGPASAATHHTTGLWLVPAFLAAASGRPVIWNGVGASPEVPPWAAPILGAVLEASALVTVRDGGSRSMVRAMAPDAECAVVPDAAFGVRSLLDELETGDQLRAWREEHGLERPYVVVQASEAPAPCREILHDQLRALVDRGLAVVELPVGPVLGDRLGSVAPVWSDIVRVDPFPSPALLAQIVAHAEAVVGHSLHLGITALCHGVPLHRPRSWPGQKYEILSEFPGVYQFDERGGEPHLRLAERVGRGKVGAEVVREEAQLARHWDRVAQVLARTPGEGARRSIPVPLARALVDALNALGRSEDALAASRLETEGEEEGRQEAERRRRLAEEEVAGLQRLVEEQRAVHTELRLGLEELRGRADEERLRREDELRSRLGRAEGEVERLSRSQADVVALQRLLDGIYASRSWRTATRLRRLYSFLRFWR